MINCFSVYHGCMTYIGYESMTSSKSWSSEVNIEYSVFWRNQSNLESSNKAHCPYNNEQSVCYRLKDK
jgi:hypothetical protein